MRLVKVIFVSLLQLQVGSMIEASCDINLYNASLEAKSPKVKDCFAEIINGTFSGYIIFANPIDNLTARSTVDAIRENKKKYRIFAFIIDFCKSLREMTKNSISLNLYLALSKYGNLAKSCPMEPNFNYTFKNFRLSRGILPSYAPQMSFFIDIKVFSGKEYVYNLKCAGKLEASRKKIMKT